MNSFKKFSRNLSKQKTVGTLSICSLAIAITVVIRIGLWSVNELSFDNFHKDKDKIYRVLGSLMLNNEKMKVGSTYKPLGQEAQQKYPEISGMCRVVSTNTDIKLKDVVSPDNKILQADSNFFTFFAFSLKAGDPREALRIIETKWKEANPNLPFKCHFLDDTYAQLYKSETNTGNMLSTTVGITLIISISGLFSMTYYTTQRRLKEIGVRKVNGASVTTLLMILNCDFFAWIEISFLIACPLSYFLISRWLESFTDRTAISWWVFAVVGAITFMITAITVSHQTWKGANVNPVKMLKAE